MFDSHIHTRNSSDSRMTPEELFEGAREAGLSGLAVTDHVEFDYIKTIDQLIELIENSQRDAHAVQAMSGGTLEVLCGAEFGGAPYDLEGARRVLSCTELDVVLGSIHGVKGNGFHLDSYRMDFSQMTEEEIILLLQTYFERVRELVLQLDVDVLAHLTYPLRYINGKYQRGIDIRRFFERIDEILGIMIERGIALEVNTSSLDSLVYDFVPPADIVTRYRDLGGRLITLGSDAHRPERVGKGIAEGKKMLRSLGFTEYHYFKGRRPVAVSLIEEGI